MIDHSLPGAVHGPNVLLLDRHFETVEEFLARGGRIERIEDHPDPAGRVLLRGWRENPFGPPLRPGAAQKRMGGVYNQFA
jgi:hypothetical protein